MKNTKAERQFCEIVKFCLVQLLHPDCHKFYLTPIFCNEKVVKQIVTANMLCLWHFYEDASGSAVKEPMELLPRVISHSGPSFKANILA